MPTVPGWCLPLPTMQECLDGAATRVKAGMPVCSVFSLTPL